MSIYCSKCGAANEPGWKFCVSCGSAILPPIAGAGSAQPGAGAPADSSRAAEQGGEPAWGPGADGGFRMSPAPGEPRQGQPHAGPASPYSYSGSQMQFAPAIPHPDLPLAGDGIGELLGKSFRMYFANLGTFFGAYWVIMLIVLFATMIAMFIPIIGGLAQFAIMPVMVGIYYVYLRAIRGYRTEIGDAFSCLSEKYIPALIAIIVQGFMMMIPMMLAFFLTFGMTMFKMIGMNDPKAMEDPKFWMGMLVNYLIFLLLVVLMTVFVAFVLPLIADGETDFWRAITRSAVFAWKNYFEVLLVMLLMGAIAFAGVLVLFIGTIFTGPLSFVILMSYYEARKERF